MLKTPQAEYDEVQLNDLLYYYEVRMSVLSEYSDRVWNRFNWFLTFQLAIFGFYFSHLEKNSTQTINLIEIPMIGVFLVILWLLMGFEDYLSMQRHSKRVKDVEGSVEEHFHKNGFSFGKHKINRLIRFRQTWLLFVFPAIVFAIWLWLAFL